MAKEGLRRAFLRRGLLLPNQPIPGRVPAVAAVEAKVMMRGKDLMGKGTLRKKPKNRRATRSSQPDFKS